MQAGSVQLARSPTPMPFHWGYNKQLHCTGRKKFLIVRDTKIWRPSYKGNAHRSRSSNRTVRPCCVWMKEATPEVDTTCFMFPILLQQHVFQIHGQGPKGFFKNISFWNSKTKITVGSAFHTRHLQTQRFCWSQMMFSRRTRRSKYGISLHFLDQMEMLTLENTDR